MLYDHADARRLATASLTQTRLRSMRSAHSDYRPWDLEDYQARIPKLLE